jgi:D-alanyl-D-alanine carboxypeptidase
MKKKKFPSKFPLGFFLLFLFGLSLFLLPSQSALVAQAYSQKSQVKKLGLTLPPPAAYPLKKTDLDEPTLTATAAAILDRRSGVFLFTKNPRQRLLPASTIKMMTALISLEHFSPLEVLMVPAVSAEGQDMKLVPGELITVEALLYGLLVSSANDAAEVLAKNYPGGEAKFVKAMNEKAQSLSLKNSFFSNPTGLDNGLRSFSSAQDLAWLADQALENESFTRIVATKSLVLTDPQKRFAHYLYNLNRLLWTVPEVRGIKTGWTEEARECLVTLFNQGDHELIFVVLGSEDRFGETKKLIDWTQNNFNWQALAPLSTQPKPPEHKP